MPTLALGFTIEPDVQPMPVLREPLLDVVCDFVDGHAFGTILGVGLRSVDKWWTVKDVIASPHSTVSCACSSLSYSMAR